MIARCLIRHNVRWCTRFCPFLSFRCCMHHQSPMSSPFSCVITSRSYSPECHAIILCVLIHAARTYPPVFRSSVVCAFCAVMCSFYPEVLLVCGSPVGMFLSIRQSSGKSLFKFNTTNRFFNLFHVREREREACYTDLHSRKPTHTFGCLKKPLVEWSLVVILSAVS